MSDYPLLLNLRNRLCVVVGGGPVGKRKVDGLLSAGARVRLVDPEKRIGKDLCGDVEILHHPFTPGDICEAFLVIAATNDREVNSSIVREARSRGILVSRVDLPEEGDFTLPATLHRGDLTVAVSTGGRSPALSALVRDHLSEFLPPAWKEAVEIASALRRKRLTGRRKDEYNQLILRRLLGGDLLSLIAAGDTDGIDRLLESVAGHGVTLCSLGLHGLKKG